MNQERVTTAEFQTFVGGQDKYVDKNLNAEELVNFYIERMVSGRKANQFVLRPTEGSKTIYEFEGSNSNIRALYKCSRGFNGENDNALVCVAGSAVYYAQTVDGAETLDWQLVDGFLSTINGQVDITDNGYQIFICDAEANQDLTGDGYWIDFGLTVTPGFKPVLVKISNENMPVNPIHCTQCGPYTCIIGTVRETGQSARTTSRFYFSNIAGVTDPEHDPSSGIWFSAVSFEGSASFYSPIRNLESLGGLLWIFGDEGFEAWQATGNWRQEFQRVPSAFSSGNGLYAQWSLKSTGSELFWLGTGNKGNAIAYMLAIGSLQPVRISLVSLEEEWANYPDANLAVGAVYSARGHSFYLLTFPQSRNTFVFDLSTGTWHRRHFYDGSELRPWKPNYTQTIRNRTFGCTIGESVIYELAEPHLGDDGRPIYRKRVSPCYNVGLMRSMHYELALDLQSGREHRNGERTNYMLRYSDDGGYTWSNPMTQSNGGRGEYARQLQFRRLGQARKRVYEFSMVDPVGTNIAGARLTTQLSSMRI